METIERSERGKLSAAHVQSFTEEDEDPASRLLYNGAMATYNTFDAGVNTLASYIGGNTPAGLHYKEQALISSQNASHNWDKASSAGKELVYGKQSMGGEVEKGRKR